MARHRSDSPTTTAPRTLVPAGPRRPAAPMHPGTDPFPEPSPAFGLPVVGVAPETNRLDLAAIALASARSGGSARPPAPPSPAVGIPVARSAPPVSGPVPVPREAGGAAHGAPAGPWRRMVAGRRAVAGLAVVGAVAGAGVAVVGVTSALAAPDTPGTTAPAPAASPWAGHAAPGDTGSATQGGGAADGGNGGGDASTGGDAGGGY